MSDGKTHEKYTRYLWTIIIPIGGILFLITRDFLYVFLLYFNYILYEVSSPDLDHVARNKDETDAIKFFSFISLGHLVPKKYRKKKPYIYLHRVLGRFNLGIIGALYVGWAQIYAYICLESAYLVGKKTSHRVWLSHWWFFSVISRIIWFNVPLGMFLVFMVNYSISSWGHPSWEILGFNYYWMNIWLIPYGITQLVAWFIGDGAHLILDTEWAKGRLYGFEKFGDKRNHWQRWLTKRINKK